MDADDAGVLDPEGRRVGAQIRLVEDDELRPLVETRAVEGELAVDRCETRVRVSLRPVDDVDEEASPLEVGEERVTEPDAAARALDQARDVGDRSAATRQGPRRSRAPARAS
jgi:hypothetical protein